MLSMAGFPLTGGFLGKLFVFSAIYEAGWWWLVVIGVLATALSLAYYLNVVRSLFMRSGEVRQRGSCSPQAARRRATSCSSTLGGGARGHDRLVLLRAAARRPRERRRRLAAVLGSPSPPATPPRDPAHRVAGAEVGDPGRVERADRERAAVGGEREDVREHAAVREDLRRVADRVDERLVEPVRPRSPPAHDRGTPARRHAAGADRRDGSRPARRRSRRRGCPSPRSTCPSGPTSRDRSERSVGSQSTPSTDSSIGASSCSS